MKCVTVNFTKEGLDEFLPSTDSYEVADAKVSGLRLRINPGGSKTFNLFRKFNGRQIRYKLGRFPEMSVLNARNAAIDAISKFNAGNNLNLVRSLNRKEVTFRTLWDVYFQEHLLLNTKRPMDNQKMMEKHVFPQIGNYKLSEISRENIKQVHTAIWKSKYPNPEKDVSYAHADRIVTIISSVFNFATKEGHFRGLNPCIGVKKNRHVSRDRFLSEGELHSFFTAANEEVDLFRDFFLMLLFTGARKSNLLSMRWSDVDFDLKRWRIPETQTKNKDVNIVLLSEPAIKILSERSDINNQAVVPSKFVFPGNGEDGYLKDPKRAFKRVRERMKTSDIRMHDLRRTLGSYMAISGASLPIIGKALNHKSQSSTAIYARLSQNPVHAAVNAATDIMLEQSKT